MYLYESYDDEMRRKESSINEVVTEYNRQIIKETFDSIKIYNEDSNSIIDDKRSVTSIIQSMKKNLQEWLKMAVQQYSNLSDDINDTYIKINDLLDHDKLAAFKHRNDLVDYIVKLVVLKANSGSTLYKFQYDQLYCPIDQVYDWIEDVMNSQPVNYLEFNDVYKAVDKWYKENHSYIEITTSYIKTETYRKMKLGKAVKYSASYVKGYYRDLHNINTVVSNEIIYLNAIQKAYDGLTIKYKKDQVAMMHIDKIFKYCLAFTNRSIEWNTSNFSAVLSAYQHHADQIEKWYEIIKS